MQVVGHVVVERGAHARAEIVEKDKSGDDPQVPPVERGHQAVKGVFHALQIDPRSLLGDQKNSSADDGKRRAGDDGGGDVQRGGGLEPLHQLAADNRGGQGSNVVPEPLLIDESPAFAHPLAIFDQDRAAQRARYRHRIGGEHQGKGDISRRKKLSYPRISGDRRYVREDQIAFASIAEQRDEVRNHAVERLYEPRQVENGEKGGDLDGRPVVHFLQIIGQRLRDQSDDLTKSLDDINETKEQKQLRDIGLAFRHLGGR